MERINTSGRNGGKGIFSKAKFLLFAFVLISVGLNLLTHELDNKFTYNGEVEPVLGVFYLSEEDIERQAYFISKDWEIFTGIVSPAEAVEAKAYVTVGQYAGFELGERDGDPYGSATYKMRLLLPEKPGRYMLELPEIFSAYQLFVNEELLLQSGDPDSEQYAPEILQTRITFEAAGETELVVQVSNFSHYYSGMVYPPGFGGEQEMSKVINGRLIIKSLQYFLAFLMFAYYLAIFFFNKKERMNLYFSIICLGYVGYSSYFLVCGFLKIDSLRWYAVETFFFLLMLCFLCELVCGLWGDNRSGIGKKIMRGVSLIAMAAALLAPALMGGSLQGMLIYGGVVDFYKLVVTAYLIFLCAGMNPRGKAGYKALTFALVFFGISLGFDTLDRYYEPVLLGWGAEYAGFVLLGVLAVRIFISNTALAKENKALLSQADRKEKYIQEVVHDLRAPLTSIVTFAELTRSGVAEEAGRTEEYLLKIESRARELAERIQRMGQRDDRELKCCPVESLIYLRELAETYIELFNQKGIELLVSGQSFTMEMDREKMDCVMENLLMNSLRFTQRGGRVELCSGICHGRRELIIRDTGIGIEACDMNVIFNRGATQKGCSETKGSEMGIEHKGLGLSIVEQIVKAHNGSVSVESTKGQGSSFILRF